MQEITLTVVDNGKRQHVLPENSYFSAMPNMALQRTKLDEGYYIASANDPFVPWGNDNRQPTQIRQKLEKVPLAMSAIDKLVKMMYGDGIVYYMEEDLKNGTNVKRAYVQEVETFLRNNQIGMKWFVSQCWDYRLYANTFTELILSDNGERVVEMYHRPAEHMRLARQNQKNLKVEYAIYSALFPQNTMPNTDDTKKVPLYRWDEHDAFFEWLKGKKFIYHSYLPSPGMTYYANPPWIGLFQECGWLEVAANVPQIVSAMQNNQITLKYQIKISIEYFRRRNTKWDEYTDVQRDDLIRKKITDIDTYLAGGQNAYKSWADVFEEDPITHELVGDIKIIPVDDKTKSGTWVPDSNAADAQIVQSLGLHPSQVGLAPEGGKMGAGSGSDQRESFNTQIGLNNLEQEIILEPLNLVSRINKWGVKFAIAHTSHTTTNVQESGLIPSSSTTQIQ